MPGEYELKFLICLNGKVWDMTEQAVCMGLLQQIARHGDAFPFNACHNPWSKSGGSGGGGGGGRRRGGTPGARQQAQGQQQRSNNNKNKNRRRR